MFLSSRLTVSVARSRESGVQRCRAVTGTFDDIETESLGMDFFPAIKWGVIVLILGTDTTIDVEKLEMAGGLSSESC